MGYFYKSGFFFICSITYVYTTVVYLWLLVCKWEFIVEFDRGLL